MKIDEYLHDFKKTHSLSSDNESSIDLLLHILNSTPRITELDNIKVDLVIIKSWDIFPESVKLNNGEFSIIWDTQFWEIFQKFLYIPFLCEQENFDLQEIAFQGFFAYMYRLLSEKYTNDKKVVHILNEKSDSLFLYYEKRKREFNKLSTDKIDFVNNIFIFTKAYVLCHEIFHIYMKLKDVSGFELIKTLFDVVNQENQILKDDANYYYKDSIKKTLDMLNTINYDYNKSKEIQELIVDLYGILDAIDLMDSFFVHQFKSDHMNYIYSALLISYTVFYLFVTSFIQCFNHIDNSIASLILHDNSPKKKYAFETVDIGTYDLAFRVNLMFKSVIRVYDETFGRGNTDNMLSLMKEMFNLNTIEIISTRLRSFYSHPS